MHTPGQVSDLLDIPPSTLRRWAVQFSDYLSDYAKGRKRQYTDQDVAIIGQIKDLSDQGIFLKDIPPHLDNVVIDQEGQEDQETTSALLSTKDAQQLRSVIAQLRSGQEKTDQRVEDLNERMDSLINLIIEKLLPPE